MSRVLRQIFKKIFCGDLFRPAAIFFCAPAAALSPSRTVCAPLPSPADACALLVSFPAVLYSRPAPPDFSPARSLLSCSLCLLLRAGLVQTSLFPEQSVCPFSCHARTRPARIFSLRCSFLYCRVRVRLVHFSIAARTYPAHAHILLSDVMPQII